MPGSKSLLPSLASTSLFCRIADLACESPKKLAEQVVNLQFVVEEKERAIEVVKQALAQNAAAVILAHNHPSGKASLSPADISASGAVQRLSEAAGLKYGGALAIAFDNVVLYDALQQANATLELRVQERTRELSAANARLHAQWMRARRAMSAPEAPRPGLFYYLFMVSIH